MPITANIIHMAKHTVKATVLAVTTETCLWLSWLMGLAFVPVLVPGTLGEQPRARLICVNLYHGPMEETGCEG
jgi:hypothetical protein